MKKIIESCPICGSKPQVWDTDMDHAVACSECPCEVSDWTKSIDELIVFWNTRTEIKNENRIEY